MIKNNNGNKKSRILINETISILIT